MSTVAPYPETRIVLSNISWATYEALVADNDSPGKRLVYDRGTLEIMSPSQGHERNHRLLGRLVETYTMERNIPIRSTGAATLKAPLKERGLEPDQSYYITNESLVRGRDDLDLTRDPPPDLAVEVEISRSAMDKLAIYGDLGVPEVWFYDGESLRMSMLQVDRTYKTKTRSSQLPLLTTKILEGFLARRHESDETTWIRSFHEWVRAEYVTPHGLSACFPRQSMFSGRLTAKQCLSQGSATAQGHRRWMSRRLHGETVSDHVFKRQVKLFVVLHVRGDHP